MKPSGKVVLTSAHHATRDRVEEESVALGPDDFQRIGLGPKETRLDVIRRAASRATKSLARRQLNAPHPLTEQQLSQIAVSTYRLLDPRQRPDRISRANVGRIRPGILHHAAKAAFFDGKILITSGDRPAPTVAAHHPNDRATCGEALCGEALCGEASSPSEPLTTDCLSSSRQTKPSLTSVPSPWHGWQFFAAVGIIVVLIGGGILLPGAGDRLSQWFHEIVNWSSVAK